ISILMKSEAVCFDTETTGTDANTAEIIGMSFAVEAYKAWYVPIPLNQEDCQGILAKFKPFFADESIRKIGQNLKYDLLLLSRYGVEVRGELFDTMLAHYLLDPDTRHGMDVLA